MNSGSQTFSQKIKQTFGKHQHQEKDKKKGHTKEFIAKLSRGLMLPIAMLPIAGLFLGIGAAVVTAGTSSHNAGLQIFGNFLKLPGDVVFGALPVLFAIAIAIAFTKDAGPAALSAFIGYLVFGAIQTALIGKEITALDGSKGYNLLFYLPGTLGYQSFGLPSSLFSETIGINQLSTSVFGGFIVGFLVAFIYNKWKNIQLPQAIGFFSGVRFIPIATFAILFPVTILVLMIWPLVGVGFNYIGIGLASAIGFNSFAFGFIERSLVPFGLHHAFYTPLWYTAVGGSLNLTGDAITSHGIKLILEGSEFTTWGDIAVFFGYDKGSTGAIMGDQSLWAFANSYLVGQTLDARVLATGEMIKHTITFSDLSSGALPWKESFNNGINGANIGQYMMGKYPFMMFGLPAAAVAMIMTTPKGNRKVAGSIIFSAAFTSFLTGITEPLEFTFLFLAPWLFWGFHAVMCAFSFGMMNWIGLLVASLGAPQLAPHIGMTFSGGAIDWVVYGGIQLGSGSNAWWSLVVGAIYVPIYYFFFCWAIKKFDIQTPGRGSNTRLFSKQDFANKNVSLNKDKALAIQVIDAYGGIDNIKNVDACITKLRIQVANQSLVDGKKLTSELGARGVIKPSPHSVYAVYGGLADVIKNYINDIIKDIEQNPKLKKQYFSAAVIDGKLEEPSKTNASNERIVIKSPVDGKIVLPANIPDETFNKEMLGIGCAIKPDNGDFVAPVDGVMAVVFNTKHAYGFEMADGTQVLLHIGIDSYNLKTRGGKKVNVFSTSLKEGDKIKVGEKIVTAKIDTIEKLAKSPVAPIVVMEKTLSGRRVKLLKNEGDKVKKGDPIIEVIPF